MIKPAEQDPLIISPKRTECSGKAGSDSDFYLTFCFIFSKIFENSFETARFLWSERIIIFVPNVEGFSDIKIKQIEKYV